MSDSPSSRCDTVWIETFGCQMNTYDTAAMYGILGAHGYRRAQSVTEADVVLLNTCSVRDLAEHKINSRLGELRSQHRRGIARARVVGVTGCMAERLSEHLTAGQGRADLVLGVDRYDELPVILDRTLGLIPDGSRVTTGHLPDIHYVAPPEAYPTNNSHLVTIHKGCDYKCTYCIVPATRGVQREKPIEVIVREIEAIVAAGGREVTLLGQNVTAYRGADLDFAGLLRRLDPLPGLERIRFLTGHPCDMSEDLIRTIGELETVCPWLHVPAQSGSDGVLRRMKRHYTRNDYLAMVAQARRWIKNVTFSGDFIVGFPGETTADFERTLELLLEVGYDQTFNFKYSERPGTPAAKLEDDVAEKTKKDRLAVLMSHQDESWQRLASAQVGQRWRIVLEGAARRPADTWRGRTANNRKVVVPWPDGRIGQTLEVRITGHQATTFFGTPV